MPALWRCVAMSQLDFCHLLWTAAMDCRSPYLSAKLFLDGPVCAGASKNGVRRPRKESGGESPQSKDSKSRTPFGRRDILIIPSPTQSFSVAEDHGRSKHNRFESPTFVGESKTSFLRRRCSWDCQKRMLESVVESWRSARFHFGSPMKIGRRFEDVFRSDVSLENQTKLFSDDSHSLRGYPERNDLFSGCHGHGSAWPCFCCREDTATQNRDRGTRGQPLEKVPANQLFGQPLRPPSRATAVSVLQRLIADRVDQRKRLRKVGF